MTESTEIQPLLMRKNRIRQSPAAPRSAGGARAIGSFLPRVAKAAFQKHGFPGAEILSEWPAIAGADLAGYTAPERLIWPRRPPDGAAENQTGARGTGHRQTGATLILRVDGPRAIEIQHGAPQIIDRINTYFGYRAVTTVRIVQGPVVRDGLASEQDTPAPTPDETGLERVEDEKLRTALARLRARVD